MEKSRHIFHNLIIALLGLLLIPVVVILLGLLYVNVLTPLFYTVFPSECTVTEQPVNINAREYNHANNCQKNASVWMAEHDGRLLFYSRWCTDVSERTKYYNQLSVFEDGTATRLDSADAVILARQGDYIYYYAWSDIELGKDKYDLYCLNAANGKKTYLASVNWQPEHSFVSADDGTLYILADNSEGRFYPVAGNTVGSQAVPKETYLLNDNVYSTEGEITKQLYVTDSSGIKKKIDNIPGGEINIIPCDAGLLVHNPKDRDMLFLIDAETNELINLFPVSDGHPESTVNIHGNDVFLSFSRDFYHEDIDSYAPIENDTLVGTYRISMDDFSVKKISDSVYTGLYIFDDSGIFACDDNSHIYKLDFDGNTVLTLLE